MSEFKPGDSDIWIHAKDAMQKIALVCFAGRDNPEFAIERLKAIIVSIEYEINLLKEIPNDKA